MIKDVSHTGIDRGSQDIPTFSPSNSPSHLSPLLTTISVSNHSAAAIAKVICIRRRGLCGYL